MRILLALFLVLFLVHFCFTSTSMAADGVSVQVAPKFTHILLNPTSSYSHVVALQNTGDPTYFSFQTRTDPSILVSMSSKRTGFDERIPLLLDHNEVFEMQIRVRARSEDIDLKDYMVEFVTSPKNLLYKSAPGINVRLNPEIITKLLISITPDGATDMQPRIVLFRNPNGYLSLDSERQELSLIAQNTGTQGTYIQGVLRVEKPSGAKDIVTIPLTYLGAQSQQKIHTLSSSSESLYVVPAKGIESGMYHARVQLQVPGQHGPLLYASTSFYVLSEVVLTGVSLAAILIFGLVVLLIYRHLYSHTWKPVNLERS